MKKFFSLLLAGSLLTSTVHAQGRMPAPAEVTFNVLSVTESQTTATMKIRVRWNAVSDAYGPADWYLHTMTSSKVVTNVATGPLPTLKRVNGIVDTVIIVLNIANDSVSLTSNVWTVRRGLQSLSARFNTAMIRRGDIAPPPPDSVRVDTVLVGFVFGRGTTYTMGPKGDTTALKPWLDTLRFARIYVGNPGAPYVQPTDRVLTGPGDTVVVVGYHSPIVRYSVSNPSIALTKDSRTGIFRTLNDANQTVFIIAQYGTYRDSLRVVTVPNPYCQPWPDCYFNPQLYFAITPELPRVYIDTSIPPSE